ncbi:MAG: (d)CMP kinase [Chloroflexota bacterium]|nr:(d)CMP kinase [Chloroflexota bacterium]
MPKVATIAIDGPVASGKTVVGRRVADALGFRFLDSGVMYRAVSLSALRNGVPIEDDALTTCASDSDISLGDSPEGTRVLLDGEDITDRLRDPEVEGVVSRVAAMAGVRRVLVAKQQAVAADGPIVMVGRDIGTVVLADADVKAYLLASVEERAKRRHAERVGTDKETSLEAVEAALKDRDYIDSNRAASPLRPAEDAVVIDTDSLTIDQVVERVIELAAERSRNA